MPESSTQLSRDIGASQFFTLAFGSIIGVGWVVALSAWLNQAGPLGAVIGFVGGGVLIMLVGLCYVEISTMFPVSGGEVVYTYEIFGTKTSFMVGWLFALAYIAIAAFEAISIGWIAGTLFPGIQGKTLYTSGGSEVQAGTLLLGLGGMALLIFLNYRGTKFAAAFQDLLTYAKIGLAVIFISVGILWGNTNNLAPLFRPSASGSILTGIFAVFLTAPFWYGGFNIIPQVMGEKAPNTSLKTVGRTLLFSIAVSGAFYCLIILACSMSLPREQLAVLNLPVAEVFTAAYNFPTLTKVVLVTALLGNFTAWNGVVVSGSRILFGLGRAHIIWRRFGNVHPVFRSPATSVIFVGVVATLGVFLGRSAIIPIVNLASACFVLGYLLICIGVLKLRRTLPEHERPYRVPGGIVTAVFAVAGAVFMLFLSLYQPYVDAKGSFPLEWSFLLGWVVLGAIFWVVAKRIRGGITEQQRRKLIIEASGSVD
ncbi:MAG TPA: APC family permease [Pyrinomonadaceae bacterium]